MATVRLEPEYGATIETGDLLDAKSKAKISTGSLLTPSEKGGVNTGNLLAAESVSGIETGSLLTANALPVTSDFPLNYARIGYDNLMFGGGVSYTIPTGSNPTSEASALLLTTPSTWDKLRVPAPYTNFDIRYLFSDNGNADYLGIAAHNLGSVGATLRVYTTTNSGSNWDLFYTKSCTDNKAIYARFTGANINGVRVVVVDNDPVGYEIGVLFIGKELEMMRPIFTGHKPAPLSATDVMTPQVSDGGQFLGKQIVRRGYATSADFQHLTDEWYRDKFQPFVEHAKTMPYFWAWNLLESPDDIVYAWTNSNISPSYMGIRNWLEVSFEIEAHA